LPEAWDQRSNFSQLDKKVWGTRDGGVAKAKQLEVENQGLKQLVADLSLDKQMLQDVVKKNV